MTKEQLMALGLTEEQAQQILDGFGQMVPKSRLDEKIKELKTANETIAERDTQIKDLEPLAAGNKDLLDQITKLQADNKTAAEQYQADLAETQRTYALDGALKDAKVHNVKAVKALLDNEKIKLNGDALEGLTEQLEALKQSDAYLFTTEKADTPPAPSFSGGQHTPPAGGNPDPFAAKLAKYE
ncbi:phage scaffolding protein [Solibacillus sp. FSL R7-0668]|uniref:phage scaffolding protein n=1 Tax=Solibacillus sp. FSL R7-0668 TaxID=2921688 RepID=UPI0030FAC3D9